MSIQPIEQLFLLLKTFIFLYQIKIPVPTPPLASILFVLKHEVIPMVQNGDKGFL
jgi:hypothetical protein